MGKTFDTKRKILGMLRSGPKTPSEIWRELGLAPSTVSQHLKELRDMGEIEEGYDEHLRNIKYYRLVGGGSAPVLDARSRAFILLGSIAAVAVISTVLFYAYTGRHGQGPPQTVAYVGNGLAGSMHYRQVQFSLTDPAQVPNGTTSLLVAYTSLKAYLNSSLQNNVIELNSTGTVNLMGLVNASKLLGSANVPSNTAIKAVSFVIANATISIDNSTYPIVLANRTVDVAVGGEARKGNATVLLDMSPVVTAVYGKGLIHFVMVPSISALEIGELVYSGKSEPVGSNSVPYGVQELNSTFRKDLAANATVLKASNVLVAASGSRTSVELTVMDDSSRPVTLTQVIVSGNESLYAYLNISQNSRSAGTYLPVSAGGTAQDASGALLGNPYSAGGTSGKIGSGNLTGGDSAAVSGGFGAVDAVTVVPAHEHVLIFNQTTLSDFIGSIGTAGKTENASYFDSRVRNDSAIGSISRLNLNNSEVGSLISRATADWSDWSGQQRFHSINFLVSGNGTLELPESESSFVSPGYTIGPGQSVNLKYNGSISLDSGNITVSLVPGQVYLVYVAGNGNAHAQAVANAI